MSKKTFAFLTVTMLCAAACSSTNDPVDVGASDTGADSGQEMDSGNPSDTGNPMDGGPQDTGQDTGVFEDAEAADSGAPIGPKVLNISPADDAVGVPGMQVVTVEFDTAMDSTVNSFLVLQMSGMGGNTSPVAGAYSNGDTVLEFTVNAMSGYNVSIDISATKDLDGNALLPSPVLSDLILNYQTQ